MKKTILLTIVSILFLITLYACTEQTPAQPQDVTLPDTPETADTTDTAAPTSDADSLLDTQLFQEGTSQNDAASCDQILDTVKKEECNDIVAANLTTKSALVSMDDSICSSINLDRYKENCISKVKSEIETENQREEILENNTKEDLVFQDAIDTDDIALCETLIDENQKASCNFNIYANRAIQEGDPKICDSIGDAAFIELCREGVAQ